jgi:hypothetical protein
MPQIINEIPPQGFELILPRIADILIDEIGYQVTSGYNSDIDVNIFVERDSRIGVEEMPAINISLARGNFDNKNAPSADGTYLYNIDVFTRAGSTDNKDGDNLANIQLQRIIGVCRYVFENQAYKTLGFAPPFISRVKCNEFNIASINPDDAANCSMGRLVLEVRANEVSALGSVRLMDGYDTVVKMGTTEFGYAYSGGNPIE